MAFFSKKNNEKEDLAISLKLGLFLAIRQIRRGSLGTTILIISVMALTFLNLVFIGGILVGLIDSSVDAQRELYSGDIIISTLDKKSSIQNSPAIIAIAKNLPWSESVIYRYTEGGTIQANYKNRINYNDEPDSSGGLITGIDPALEDSVTHLSKYVIKGSYLTSSDADYVLVGSDKLFDYLPIESPGFTTLKNVGIGTKVRVVVGGNTKEFTVKGIIKSKVGEVDNRVFMLDSSLRALLGRTDYSVNEIVLMLKDPALADVAKEALLRSGVGSWARVQTWEEAQPKFLKDIKGTFSLLGDIVGSIGLVVASITIFIVIFINAITRRKFIGILRGIGVNSLAIEFSYVLQSLFYALIGTILGLIILFGVLKPFFDAHPINFPFSDGTLVVSVLGASVRAVLLVIASLIAGYIPAKIVIRQKPLDAILGR